MTSELWRGLGIAIIANIIAIFVYNQLKEVQRRGRMGVVRGINEKAPK